MLVLGDSVTEGFGVDFEDVYTQRLQSLLDRSGAHDEVVSPGVSQYSTAQEVALFEDVGLAMSPDLVILSYVLNDPAADGSINDFFRRDRAPSLALTWLRSRVRFLTSGRGRRVVGCVSHDYYSELHCDADEWGASAAALDRLAQLSQQHGLPVLLVIFPRLDSTKASFEPYAWDATRRQVLEAATRRHFATLDLLQAFAERRPADLALKADDVLHPNRGGHEIAATAIHQTLVAQRLMH